jgi:hypothetical protein
MSLRHRALIIGLAGAAIQAIGIAWALVHLLAAHVHNAITARHIVFEAPFLLVIVGFLVTLVCVPVALEVGRASDEDVSLPVLGLEVTDDSLAGSPALGAGK